MNNANAEIVSEGDSQDFNYTGIAVVNSIDSGKIFVQVFIAK